MQKSVKNFLINAWLPERKFLKMISNWSIRILFVNKAYLGTKNRLCYYEKKFIDSFVNLLTEKSQELAPSLFGLRHFQNYQATDHFSFMAMSAAKKIIANSIDWLCFLINFWHEKIYMTQYCGFCQSDMTYPTRHYS